MARSGTRQHLQSRERADDQGLAVEIEKHGVLALAQHGFPQSRPGGELRFRDQLLGQRKLRRFALCGGASASWSESVWAAGQSTLGSAAKIASMRA